MKRRLEVLSVSGGSTQLSVEADIVLRASGMEPSWGSGRRRRPAWDSSPRSPTRCTAIGCRAHPARTRASARVAKDPGFAAIGRLAERAKADRDLEVTLNEAERKRLIDQAEAELGETRAELGLGEDEDLPDVELEGLHPRRRAARELSPWRDRFLGLPADIASEQRAHHMEMKGSVRSGRSTPR